MAGLAREVQMSGSCSVASVGLPANRPLAQSMAALGSLSGFAAFSAASLGSLVGLVPH